MMAVRLPVLGVAPTFIGLNEYSYGVGLFEPNFPAALLPNPSQQDYLWRAFSFSSARFSSSSFCPASPSLPSAVRRW
jgi:hypothetical protein